MRELNIDERVRVTIFYEEVFSRKESASERVKRDEWAQQRGDASLLNAKRYNGTSVAIDFGSSVAIMSALHVRPVGSQPRTRSLGSRNNRDNCTRTICSRV